MSRTDKDAPYKIRARRYGRRETDHCRSCGTATQHTDRHRAVFYAHEVREREVFTAQLEERGYTVKAVERYGFLTSRLGYSSTGFSARQLLPRFMRRNATAEQCNFAARVVKRVPDKDVYWATVATASDEALYGKRCAAGTLIVKHSGHYRHPKPNMFVEVVAELVTTREGRCWHGEFTLSAGDKHAGRGCCCDFCRNQRRERSRDLIAAHDMAHGRDDGQDFEIEHDSQLGDSDWQAYATVGGDA